MEIDFGVLGPTRTLHAPPLQSVLASTTSCSESSS